MYITTEDKEYAEIVLPLILRGLKKAQDFVKELPNQLHLETCMQIQAECIVEKLKQDDYYIRISPKPDYLDEDQPWPILAEEVIYGHMINCSYAEDTYENI